MRGSLKFLAVVLSSLTLAARGAPAFAVRSAPVLAVRSAWAQSEVFEKQRAAARVVLVKNLLGLASWCNSKELFLERDHIYTQVIALDADNLEARKGLRYSRAPDGSWKDPAPREMKNRNPKALEEFPAKRSAAVVPFRDMLLELVSGDAPDPLLRQSVYDEILAIDPDEPRVHELLGEVKVADKWMMAESAAGKLQREKIKTQVKTSLEQVPKGAQDGATDEEVKLVEAWKCALATEKLRVLSTGDAEDCARMLQVVQTAGDLLGALLGCTVAYPKDYTIFILAQPGEKETFIERLPNLSGEQRAFFQSLMGGGIPNTSNVAVWDADPKKRLDAAVRNTYGHLLRSAYRITPEQGFAFEGLGLYLTREILGTRLSWFITDTTNGGEDAEAQATRARLMASNSNWMNEALKLYDAGSAPHLEDATKHGVNAMSVGDMLVAYALTAYLLEGRAEQAGNFMAMVGSGDGAEAAAKKCLNLTLPQLEERLHRWLKERR